MVDQQAKPFQVRLIFPPELKILLPGERQAEVLVQRFHAGQSAKHLIEALGVPHTEVGHILVNGQVESLNYRVQDGDQIEIIPVAVGMGAGEPATFLLDNHLGKLTRYLRMLGFDCLYDPQDGDDTLARKAEETGRILLTRDRQLLMRKIIRRGYWVRSREPASQVAEIVHRFGLYDRVRPFHRCLHCNGDLVPVAKRDVIERLEPLTRRYYHEFHICQGCGQVYWPGSHFERMQVLVRQVLKKQDG
jgi:uncharacterized protein